MDACERQKNWLQVVTLPSPEDRCGQVKGTVCKFFQGSPPDGTFGI